MPSVPTFIPLGPHDRFLGGQTLQVVGPDGSTEFRIGQIDHYPTMARDAVRAAGLLDALFASPGVSRDVGAFLLNIPAAFRTLAEDESDRLYGARQAALREMRRLMRSRARNPADQDEAEEWSDDEAGARLLLLRLRSPMPVEAFDIIEIRLRTGEPLPVNVEDHVDLPHHVWAVIEVSASPLRWDVPAEATAFQFDYRLVHAVPDMGPLRLPDIHPSPSKSLCFDSVTRYLLSCLDLSQALDLPDPAAATQFLLEAHRRGIPRDAVPAEYLDDQRTRRPFAERLLRAMEWNREVHHPAQVDRPQVNQDVPGH